MEKRYEVEIKNNAKYTIDAKSEEEALALAEQWFSERKPQISISLYTEVLQCPSLDWSCPYYHKGECTLTTAKEDCDSWYGLEDDEDDC